MANVPIKSIKFPGLNDTYTFTQVDNTLTETGMAADAKKTGDELTDLKSALNQQTIFADNAFENGESTYSLAYTNNAMDSATGQQSDASSIRASTPDKYYLPTECYLYCNLSSGFSVVVYCFNENGTYLGYKTSGTSLSNNVFTLYESTRYFRALVLKSNNTDISTSEAVSAAQFKAVYTGKINLIDDVPIIENMLAVTQGYRWKAGYIVSDGRIITEAGTARRYSGLIVCPENINITYVAEKHASVCGISFYDKNGVFISGVNYTGSAAENTVTSPANTAFIRLSTTTTLIPSTYASFDSSGLIELSNRIAEYENRVDRYIPFVTSGSNRSALYTDLTNMQYAEVVDQSYDITLAYGSSQNTAWAKKVNINDYPSPTALQLRKADNSTMAAHSAEKVAIAIKTTSLVTHGEIDKVYFVAPNGSDTNNGLGRSSAFATIQKAINEGGKTILVKEGTYSQGFTLDGKNGVNILIDHYYDSFTAGTDEDNPKIVINGNNSIQDIVTVSNCTDCHFSNIEVKNATRRGFVITRCDGITLTDCIAHDIGIGQTGSINGYAITYTNADFYNCVAYNVGTTSTGSGTYHYDGFNIHGTGTVNFINCSAWNCEDDGVSHHDACCGLIDGGEWYNCGKGGIASPTHGAKVNVSNVYSHDNAVGILADSSDVVTTRGKILLSNCVCVNNTTDDLIVGDYYSVIAINCVYNTITGSSNVTRYGITE